MLWSVAAAQSVKYNTSIFLSIGGNSESASVLESLFRREIRSLRDVTLADKKNEAVYFFSILMNDAQNSRGKLGYVLSIAITKTQFCKTSAKNEGDLRVSDDLLDHRLFTISPDNLRNTVTEIVADFDTEILEPERKLYKSVFK